MINKRLEKLSENQKEYKIEHTPSATLTSSTTATSAWGDGFENAVGLEKEVKRMKEMLLAADRRQLMFISIFGESGVGKKTLLEVIYKCNDVTKEFEIIVWFRIPSDSTIENLLEEIYVRAWEFLHKRRASESLVRRDEGSICFADELRHLLEQKRYLVIISGISSKFILNCVRASLPNDNNGSRVLLSLDNESEEVAWHANTMNKDGINAIHMLSRLDEITSGQLFCSRVSRKELPDVKENEDMSKYGKIVYDITGGYPLAIVLLAGLLRFKEKPGQWEAVLQQLRPGPGLEEAPSIKGKKITDSVPTQANLSTRTTLERVFWASFEDLPNDLKSCFLFLAAMPKNMGQYSWEIVRIWMAEGFIKPQQGKTMEVLGYNYLKELALRCLVQIEGMNNAGLIESFTIHPRLHGFLQSEAREAGFMDVHGRHDIFVPPSVWRLSFISLAGGYTTFTNKFCKLRSFICWIKNDPSYIGSQGVSLSRRVYNLKFMCESKFLRVIHVCGIGIKELPNEIGDMIHLRYIYIGKGKDLEKLPSSIKGLLNLQTLDIMGSRVEEIHPSFWKIKTLRHVIADKLTLPASIEEELDELQTLWGVKPAQEGEYWSPGNCALNKMTKLRTLFLNGFEQSRHGAALENALGKMSLLCHLKLVGDEIPSCVFTAQSLRYLDTIELCGEIKWPEVAYDVRKVRPNLVQVKVFMERSEEVSVPRHMEDQLQGMLQVIDLERE